MSESEGSPTLSARTSADTAAFRQPTSRTNSQRNDAAMSPRRTSTETDKLADDARAALKEHAKATAASLLEIAESIELVKSDHEKLEKQNLALQDYIGGLTRSMAKGDLNISASSSGKGKSRGGKKSKK